MRRGGRRVSQNGLYAREHGLTKHQVILLGGVETLRRMSPEARDLMISLARRKRKKSASM
jgi:hypothetical protein